MKEYFNISRQEKTAVKRAVMEVLRKKSEIIIAYLYGSFIDKHAYFRDIDIALLIEEKLANTSDLFDYALETAALLTRRIKYPIDIRLLNCAALGFKHSIFKNGEVILCRDNILLEKMIEDTSLEYILFYEKSLEELVN